MSKLSLEPVVLDSQPTSHLTLGASKINPDDEVVRIEHCGVNVTLQVDAENDRVASNIGSDAKIAPEIAELFGGIDRTESFYVYSLPSPKKVRPAGSVTINPLGTPADKLEAVLKDREVLLHPIVERYDLGSEVVEFSVTDVEPYEPTVMVGQGTEFEFETDSSTPAHGSDDAGRSSGWDGGGSGGGGDDADGDGGGRGDEGASINIQPTVPEKNFEDDVAGLSEVKRTARMVLSLFDSRVRDAVVESYGREFADRGGGMMLYGPPGCGKTLISEAIAHEAKYETDIEEEYGDVVFLEVRGSDVVSKYSGESEKNVEAAFDQAHEIASGGFAVLFFDEVETLIPDRSDDNLQRHERALTNAFLQQMNDVEDNLLVIGATNMPFSIDPAATRRFPIQQFIPQPGADVMTEVWETSLGRITERDDVDCRQLGEASVGYTPAEIADRVLGSDLQRELVESVALDDRDPIQPDTEYLLARLEETEPKTVRQYVSSVMKQAQELEGFPEMKEYVEQQAQELGMLRGGGES
ncbi:ATP-binding protein [Halobaculum sp. MBLA0143]|uniref:ATP-binding protein n=1 Tax=Halobaculum sp. MBLA0143 TaxID=3079933 RepID=UPI003523F749